MHSIVRHPFLKCREGVYEKATGAGEFFYWASCIVVICGHHQEDSGKKNLIGLENMCSFRSIKLKYRPIGVYEEFRLYSLSTLGASHPQDSYS